MIAKCLNLLCGNLFAVESLSKAVCPKCGCKEARDGESQARMIRLAMLGSQFKTGGN